MNKSNRLNNTMTSKLSDHDLLLRIDERQYSMVTQLNTMNKKLECVVINDDDYKVLVGKVNSMWDSKNKLIGWMLGAGVAGGGISAMLNGIVKDVLANFNPR